MSKNKIRGYITLSVIFVVLSIIAFAAPFAKTGTFWLAYIFGVLAIAYQIYVFKISFSGYGDVKSKFYGFPIAKIGLVYFIVQLIISIIEMATAAFLPVWLTLIINIIPAAVAVIGCISVDAMRDEIVRQDLQLKKDVSNIRALQSMSSTLVGMCENAEIKKYIQDLAEEFKYSDPVSSEQTKEPESELEKQMNELQQAIIDDDTTSSKILYKKIMAGLKERNRLCALSK